MEIMPLKTWKEIMTEIDIFRHGWLVDSGNIFNITLYMSACLLVLECYIFNIKYQLYKYA